MSFETKWITPGDQIKCLDKVIDDQKTRVASFDSDQDANLQDEAISVLMALVAIREQLYDSCRLRGFDFVTPGILERLDPGWSTRTENQNA